MSSAVGKNIRLTLFGESHSKAVGAVIEGIPAGETIDFEQIQAFLDRRAPGQNSYSSPRKEGDRPIVLSGIVNGKTCGSPIAVMIDNQDIASDEYYKYMNLPRPSHSDFPAIMKYGRSHDIRGGGHFSGRLTAPLCFAGALCKQILLRKGINVFSHILSIGKIHDERYNLNNCQENDSIDEKFPVLNNQIKTEMIREIESAKKDGDSVGGIIECCVTGLPAGIGEPIFDGIENKISQMVFGIPGIKGIEFGLGFSGTELRGSEHNDSYVIDARGIKTATNNSGGALGGLSTGMHLVFRAAVKPTPSIAKAQNTVDLSRSVNATLSVEGRHDPSIVPRAVPCVESSAIFAILDLVYEREMRNGIG